MMNLPPQFGLQPHTIPRFGQNNPFVLGVPGMGGFGGFNKKRKPVMGRPGIPLGLPRPQMPKMQQFMPRSPFMGMVRPY